MSSRSSLGWGTAGVGVGVGVVGVAVGPGVTGGGVTTRVAVGVGGTGAVVGVPGGTTGVRAGVAVGVAAVGGVVGVGVGVDVAPPEQATSNSMDTQIPVKAARNGFLHHVAQRRLRDSPSPRPGGPAGT